MAVVLLLAPLSAHTQVPDYFEQHQKWSMYQSASCANTQCYCVWEFTLYVDQDTVLGQHIYKRVGRLGIHYEGAIGMPDPMNPCNTQMQQFDETYGYLRQSNDSVFSFNTDFQAEVLFVSYNLQVGDTLYPNSEGCVVDSIGSTSINGDVHRRFMYSGAGGSGVLIEGLADIRDYTSVPLGGLYERAFGPNEVACFAENDSTVWINPNVTFGQCNYFITVGVEDLPANVLEVAIHPNPANDVLNITVAEPIQYAVTLRDLAGKRLVHELNAQRIDVGRLAVGTYLIEVRGLDGQRVFRDKVIIAR